MTIVYRAVGNVRGSCGHNHRTWEAAERCRDRDSLACRRLPGGNSYSDREVRVYEAGVEIPRDEAEHRGLFPGPDEYYEFANSLIS